MSIDPMIEERKNYFLNKLVSLVKLVERPNYKEGNLASRLEVDSFCP